MPIAPGGPRLNGGCCCCCCGGCCCWSPTPLLGPWLAGRNCSPTEDVFRIKARLVQINSAVVIREAIYDLFNVPTFSHVAKRVLVGFIGAQAPLHFWGAHARLIGRVGCHVFTWVSRVATFRKGVLQVNTASNKGERGWRGGRGGQREL